MHSVSLAGGESSLTCPCLLVLPRCPVSCCLPISLPTALAPCLSYLPCRCLPLIPDVSGDDVGFRRKRGGRARGKSRGPPPEARHSFARRPKGVAKPLPLTVIASSNVAAERRRSRCSTGEAGGEPSTGGGGSEGEGGVLEMCDQCQRRVSPAAAGVTICLPTSHQRVLVICSVLRLLVLAPICSPT